MLRKSILLTSVILLSWHFLFGQSGFPYERQWKLVDSLLNKKNLPKSALTEVEKIYMAAKKENQEAQWIKAIIYKNYLQSADDQTINEQIAQLEKEISVAPVRVAAVLKSVEAEVIFQYLQEQRFQIRNRTDLTTDSSKDITTWTIPALNRRIRSLYLSYQTDAITLQRTSLDILEPVLVKGNARELRPTLFDLLAWRALDYFRIDDRFNSSEQDDLLKQNPALFSEAPYFMHVGFVSGDSLSNALSAIRIYQQLLRFHAKDLRLDAWIAADISRLTFVNSFTSLQSRDSLYLNALTRITSHFGTLSSASQAWYLQAKWWSDLASGYEPLGDTTHQFDFLKSIKICEQVVQHPEPSEGKSNCEQLLADIRRRTYQLNVEKVNLPNVPFRILVTGKNIGQLYCRILRIDDQTRTIFKNSQYDPKSWTKWIRLPFLKSFRQTIPETGDYQQHREEIKVDGLPPGQYAILTSTDSSFDEKSQLALVSFFSSGIAYIVNDLDYFVLDRDSGHPLQNVNVKTFVHKNTNTGYSYVPSKTYETDVNGNFHLIPEAVNGNTKLEFYNGKDYFSTEAYNYNFRNDANEEGRKVKFTDYLFTDRSIYRPGQTVFFKGLILTRDQRNKKYKVVSQQQTTIYLVDVNGQKTDSLLVRSSDFGSFSGSFKLPQNLLNGEFHLFDAVTENEQSFSVEEYKRPSFFADFDSVRGSYKLGDTVRATGQVMAYSGSAIDQAKVKWRVYRQTRFPYPWLFRFAPTGSNAEIAHGESGTSADGKFIIPFIALPDLSVNRASRPVFTYRVEVDVTDANGESRSANTLVMVAYQSFEIVSSLPLQSRLTADSLHNIPVSTRNFSGSYVKKNLTVSLYPLKGPARLIRKRYWAQPDLFVMTESEFTSYFPNDEYRNESDVKTWKRGALVIEHTDSTRENGLFAISGKNLDVLPSGWYEIEFSATDLNGERILDKRFVEIISANGGPSLASYNIIPSETILADPGLSVKTSMGTTARNVFVIRTKKSIVDTVSKYTYYTLSQEIKKLSIEILETDRGGFAIQDAFVKNNRWYSSTHLVEVPWTNKELGISYITWKDKTVPGNRESWKIKISGSKKEQVLASVLTSMYDASLDQFKPHSWSVPDIYPVYHNGNIWDDKNNFDQLTSFSRPETELNPAAVYQVNYDALLSLDSRYRMYVMRSAAGGRGLATTQSGEMFIKNKDAGDRIETEQSPVPAMEMKDDAISGSGLTESEKDQNAGEVQIRKNFNETAFFLPDLRTDAEGNVEINFTIPDALTRWKWMILAGTKDLAFAYSEKQLITQKELMLQTNMPRFFREGDTMRIPVKISNLSSQTLSGQIQMDWYDASSNQSLDHLLGNVKSSQAFSINALQSGVVFFQVVVPAHFTQPLLYRVIAQTSRQENNYSDGEENVVPILSNRMLVTESLPLNLNGKSTGHFTFDKLLKSNKDSNIQSQSLTVEYSANPVWYAVQSLPYLIDFPYECSEQTFNRFYANAVASHIVQLSPALQAVFEKWKNADTAALISNLQKNQELKSVLLQETPWVLQAESETKQKKNLALLFDMIRMQKGLKDALEKLHQMQSAGGGFSWFKGGRDDRYITQYIIAGLGRLKMLKSIPADLTTTTDQIARKAISYLDKEIKSDYDKRDKNAKNPIPDAIQIQYLYMRSFFPDVAVPGNIVSPLSYYRKLAMTNWMRQSVFMQAMTGQFLKRTGDVKTSGDILASLKENSVNSPELGRYWKTVRYGYYWQDAPVETQSVVIEFFQDMHADRQNIDQMKYWLLQQKHGNHWPTTRATADACYALLLSGSDWLSSQPTVDIQLGTLQIQSNDEKSEAGTGYFERRIPGDLVKPDMGNIEVSSANSGPPSAANAASWGAVYWQYFADLDKITTAQTQLSVTKNVFREKNSDKGPVLEQLSAVQVLKPGDKLRIRMIIRTDRDLEYVHLKDQRAACMEPVQVLSGYQWQEGLGYYQTTKDASTSFFFDRLPKGNYVFEYPVFVTTAGNYSNGISRIECMYSPEFAAHSEGIRIKVETK